MHEQASAYGLWLLVAVNSALFIFFAFSFAPPKTSRDWRSLGAFSAFDPGTGLGVIATLTAVVAFLSASQDIVLDAWRRELLPDEELGLGNSLFVNGYRVAALVPGSLALFLADRIPWWQVLLVVAA